MPTVTDDAIVLRLVDWSETSHIVGLLTRGHGKVSATAKGAKRQTPSVQAKFSGGLEVATLGEAVLIIREGRDLANLTEWNLVNAHWRLRRDLRSYELAMYAVDLTHHMLHDHDPHPRSFEALREVLAVLGAPASHGDDALALLHFQWSLIDDAGYRPALDRDANSGRPLETSGQTMHFSAVAGGLVNNAGADAWPVRRSTIELLRSLNGDAPSKVQPVSIDRANRLLCAYCRAILDHQLPTMRAILESRPR
jgi:DNA repair protein RecO (recombination protein O)